MKRPNEVNVGQSVWTIVWSGKKLRKHDESGPRQMGLTDYRLHKIFIDDSHPIASLRDTLLHELIHVLHGTYRLPSGKSEERTVQTLTPVLLDLMRANPILMKWLLEG